MGLEPTTAAMARRYSSQLSYTCIRGHFIFFSWKSSFFMSNDFFAISPILCIISLAIIPLATSERVPLPRDWFGIPRSYILHGFGVPLITNFPSLITIFYARLTQRSTRSRPRYRDKNLYHRWKKNHFRIRSPRTLRDGFSRHTGRSWEFPPHNLWDRESERWGFFPTHRRVPGEILCEWENRWEPFHEAWRTSEWSEYPE